MPRKVLDRDVIGYLTMTVCHELGKTEEEVSSWHTSDIFRWIAFLRLKAKAEKRAIERAKRK